MFQSSFWGVSLSLVPCSLGGVCPGGLCQGYPRTEPPPIRWKAGGAHPSGMLSCLTLKSIGIRTRSKQDPVWRLIHTVRFFLNATAFFTCDFVKLFTWCSCNLCVLCELHIAIAQNGCATHSCVMSHANSIAVTPCEQYHWHPYNPLHAIKNAVAFTKNRAV